MSRSLWPEDLSIKTVRSPVSILREQANFLEEKTTGIVSAIVQLTETRPQNDQGSQPFFYHFYITLPQLVYRYLLFGISCGIESYPVTIFLGDEIKEELGLGAENPIAKTEEEFEVYLERIFNSTKAKKVVATLWSQIEEVTPQALLENTRRNR